MLQVPALLQSHPAFRALTHRVLDESIALLGRVTGTHALLLDAIDAAAPQVEGLGRWTALRLSTPIGLEGPLRAAPDALPFCDNSFGAVLIRHLAGARMRPQDLAPEAARVLAPHGLLLVIECHPFSIWRPWLAARLRRGESSIATFPPRQWERALREAGLVVETPRRCGAPWPGTHAAPRWLERICGGAWLLAARKRDEAAIVQRLQPRRARAVAEQTSWLPGAHRG